MGKFINHKTEKNEFVNLSHRLEINYLRFQCHEEENILYFLQQQQKIMHLNRLKYNNFILKYSFV